MVNQHADSVPAVAASAPRVFISYAWEDDDYKTWVKRLGTRLRADGIEARLDAWHCRNKTIAEFMNTEVRVADKVLILCSPKYREKVHAMEEGDRMTGSGWEAMLVGSALFAGRIGRAKIVVSLTRGTWETAAPDFLVGLPYFDLTAEERFESQYLGLLRSLRGKEEEAPPVGTPPPDLEPVAVAPLRGSVGSALTATSEPMFSAVQQAVGSPDLVITSTSFDGPGRLAPLSGHPILTRQADGRPVYTGGFHVSFTLQHNGVGKPALILRGLALDILRYQPGPDPEYAYQIEGAAIIGAGVVKPHVFMIALLGDKPSSARWIVDSRTGESRVAKSANFFDTEDPRLITLAPEGDVEEIQGSVLAQKPGFYEMRFVFDYSVGGKDRRQTTDMVLVYSDD